MSIKHLFYGLCSIFLIQSCFAKPPVEILRSCIDESSKNLNIKITDIDSGSYSEHPDNNCDEQFEIDYNHKVYGTIVCNDKINLIIANKRFVLETAENFSINPEIKPGIIYPTDSSWLKIDFNEESYLCINGPISRSGHGASLGQYYIVENAFSKTDAPKLYYYFFEKDIIPLTSEHL